MDGFEEGPIDLPFYPEEQREVQLGPRERFETLDSLSAEEVKAVEAALRQMLVEDPDLPIGSQKTFRALHEKTGASKGSIGTAIFIFVEGGTTADYVCRLPPDRKSTRLNSST